MNTAIAILLSAASATVVSAEQDTLNVEHLISGAVGAAHIGQSHETGHLIAGAVGAAHIGQSHETGHLVAGAVGAAHIGQSHAEVHDEHLIAEAVGSSHGSQAYHSPQAVYTPPADKPGCYPSEWSCSQGSDCCAACKKQFPSMETMCDKLAKQAANGCTDSVQYCQASQGQWSCDNSSDCKATCSIAFGKNYCTGGSTATQAPTQAPTKGPTQAPTQAPTKAPTQAPTRPPSQTAAPTTTVYVDPGTSPSGAPYCSNQHGQYNCASMSPLDCAANNGMTEQCLFTCKNICTTWEHIYGDGCGVSQITNCQLPDGTTWEADVGAPFYPAPVSPDSLVETEPEDSPKQCPNFTHGGYWTSSNQDFSGYQPNIIAKRDGSYTLSSDGSIITVTTQIPSPPGIPQEPIKTGTYPAEQFFRMRGHQKLKAIGYDESAHDSARSRSMTAASCNKGPFEYDDFAAAVGLFPDFLGYDNVDQNKLDLASFAANSAVETSGAGVSSSAYWGFAWCFNREQDGSASSNYGTQSNFNNSNCQQLFANPTGYDTSPENVGYYGRGAMQLSWCYNYYPFTKWANTHAKHLSNGTVDFIKNPAPIVEAQWSWTAGIWFYMSPDSSNKKPSMHAVVDNWRPDVTTGDELAYDNKGLKADLGYQINILNGGMECRSGAALGSKPKRRLEYFFSFLQMLEVDTENKPYLSVTGGCSRRGTTVDFSYFYDPVSGHFNTADTTSTCSQ